MWGVFEADDGDRHVIPISTVIPGDVPAAPHIISCGCMCPWHRDTEDPSIVLHEED